MPASAIAGVSVVCALGPWVFSEAMVLRALAGAAAATAVVGAVVMRRWDTQAGKRVAELTRARAGDEWRYEERVAELETDLEESRELRTKLEQRLRAKRTELAGLRNEHAALLRRYATAETERASALEGRRLLEIEAAVPSSSPALPPARRPAPEPLGTEAADEATEAAGEAGVDAGGEPTAQAVFSPEGARLYRSALTALARFDGEAGEAPSESVPEAAEAVAPEGDEASKAPGSEAVVPGGTAPEAVAPEVCADAEVDEAVADAGAVPAGKADVRRSDAATADSARSEGTSEGTAEAARDVAAEGTETGAGKSAGKGAVEGVTDGAGGPRSDAGAPAAKEDEAQGQPLAADGHTRAAATPTVPAEPVKPVGRPPAGHFTVPTAVAVVPAAPARRPMVEGGFDFFGTQKGAPKAALDSVQNEDLADVVGPEALAVHKAEAEAEFKPAGAQEDGVSQVIDLTAHDETEQIDVQGLRSAAS
ncbi:hypothetical protein M878_18750 [Streptomyces roseochromogenus subsp. oscitans DS 12.976]|uniref:Secreted protein n=1 Tax=Streptomyces roseochromogenus subsp. oscitans DS 12.976 TaxID=1352936 RepID=V6KDU1_STRRC|nr:hypothetical protein M878_18750 [Streptomyces roseochromogenus subsp. oscitans DS 12.976]